MRNSVLVILTVVVITFLTGCAKASEESAKEEVSVERGKSLFHKAVLGGAAGCVTCHSLEPGAVLIGPSLFGIGTQAGERSPDLMAEEYLRQSILEPDAYIAAGFPTKVMPSTYQNNLTPGEVESLVIYLLSLK